MLVSFAIVAYNEEKALPKLLYDLCSQDYPKEKIEVLLIDSMSTDSTKQIMLDFEKSHSEFFAVKVFDNPKINIPSGHNVAIRNYSGDALIRLDAHASMPSSFISKNVEALLDGEHCSGGRRPNIIDGATSFKETLLAAEQSMFGSSIAPYRNGEKKMYTSSLFCGMYTREVYDRVGEYNELLPRTEDNDFCYRVRRAGYRLCFSPDIVYYQQTRNTLYKLLKQKFLNGYWIGKTLGISPKCFSLFHFVPLAFLFAIIVTTVLAVFVTHIPASLITLAYTTLVIGLTVIEFIKKPRMTHLLLPIIIFLLHISYGIGTLVGIIEMPFWVSKSKKRH